MNTLHTLLARQVSHHFGSSENLPAAVHAFLNDVDAAYREFDAGRSAIERALNAHSAGQAQANAQLRAMLVAFPDAYLRLDAQGHILEYKPGWPTDTKASAQPLVEVFPDAATRPDIARRFQDAVEAVHRTQEPAAMEYSLTADHREEFYEARLVPLPRDEIFVVVRNMTAQKQVEQALRASEFFLSKSQSVAAIGSYYFNAQTGNWISSPALDQIFGIGEDYPKNVGGWASIMHPEDRDELLRYLQDYVLAGHHRFDREYRIIRQSDHQERWVHGLGELEFDDQGRTTKMIGTIQDITARKQSERALWIKDWAIESSLSAIALTDLEGRLCYVNPAFLRIWGYDQPGQVVGRPASDFAATPSIISTVTTALQQTGQWSGEFLARRRQEDEMLLECNATLVRDRDGKAVGMMASALDITERRRGERALLELKEQLAATLSALPDLLFSIDRAGHILDYRSQSSEDLYAPPEQFLGRRVQEVLPPDAAAEVMRAVEEAFRSGINTTATYSLLIGNCQKWYELTAARQGGPHTQNARVIALVRDVTKRKQTEDRLRQSEERLHAAVQVSGIGIFEHDHVTNTVYWSPELRSIFGWSLDEPVTLPKFLDCVHPDDRERVFQAVRQAHDPAGNGRYDIEHRILHRDGSVRWIITRSQTIFEGEGDARHPVLTSGADLDLTAGQQATEALQESEERLRLALMAANQGLYDLNVQTGEALVSPEYASMLGYDPSTFRETNAFWRERLHADDRDVVYRAYADYVSGQRADYRVEFRQRTKDGGWKWILSVGKIVAWDKEGRPLRMLGTHTDITARKLAEETVLKARDELEMRVQERTEQLERAKQAAEAASEAKSRFLAMMSHEIRTPLHGVTGVLHLLLREQPSPQQRRWIDMAHASADTLLRVINDILDFSKVEAGKLDLQWSSTDLHETVHQCAATFAERTTRKGLTWNLQVDPGVPRLVMADAGRLAQVLGNLLGNAVKFTETGSVSLRVTRASEARETHRVRFAVTDTGPGIAAEQQSGLFKPFSQVDNSTTRRHGGTGLGLGICKQLVELMGGTIGVTSATGRGSTFWFELPFKTTCINTDHFRAIMAAGAPKAAMATRGDRGSQPPRVLLVEDNDINQELAREMIQMAGCECDCVSNGQDAVRAAQSGRYALAFMDCMMPGMDGYAATRAIRAAESKNASSGNAMVRLPVIALTANAMEGDREQCLAAGMDDYLSKPLEPAQVAIAIQKWLASPTTEPSSTADQQRTSDRSATKLVRLPSVTP